MVQPACFTEAAQLTNAAATQYTSPNATVSIIKKLTLCNADAANGYHVTVYLVPSGGATGVANLLINARAVGAGQTVDVTEAINQMLQPGDFISAFADTGAEVSIRISGVQIA